MGLPSLTFLFRCMQCNLLNDTLYLVVSQAGKIVAVLELVCRIGSAFFSKNSSFVNSRKNYYEHLTGPTIICLRNPLRDLLLPKNIRNFYHTSPAHFLDAFSNICTFIEALSASSDSLSRGLLNTFCCHDLSNNTLLVCILVWKLPSSFESNLAVKIKGLASKVLWHQQHL